MCIMVSAGAQPRLKAEAERTLEGVGCSAWFGWVCPVGCGWGPSTSTLTPGVCSLRYGLRHRAVARPPGGDYSGQVIVIEFQFQRSRYFSSRPATAKITSTTTMINRTSASMRAELYVLCANDSR